MTDPRQHNCAHIDDGWCLDCVGQFIPMRSTGQMSPEYWAGRFHDTYERLAPDFGYETRDDTKTFDPTSPNGRLMTRVCEVLVDEIRRTIERES